MVRMVRPVFQKARRATISPAAVPRALRIESRRADRVFDDGVHGEPIQPGSFVVDLPQPDSRRPAQAVARRRTVRSRMPRVALSADSGTTGKVSRSFQVSSSSDQS